MQMEKLFCSWEIFDEQNHIYIFRSFCRKILKIRLQFLWLTMKANMAQRSRLCPIQRKRWSMLQSDWDQQQHLHHLQPQRPPTLQQLRPQHFQFQPKLSLQQVRQLLHPQQRRLHLEAEVQRQQRLLHLQKQSHHQVNSKQLTLFDTAIFFTRFKRLVLWVNFYLNVQVSKLPSTFIQCRKKEDVQDQKMKNDGA